MVRRDRWACALLLAGSLVACMTDHAALQKRPSVSSAGGGAGGSSGAPFHQFAGSGGSGGTPSGHPDDEPPGKDTLTIVNGIVDAPRIVLCLAEVGSGARIAALGGPLGDAPLDYAHSLVVTDRPDLRDRVADGTLQLFAIAGDLEQINGLDCEHAMRVARAAEVSSGFGGSGGEGGAAGEGGASSVISRLEVNANSGAGAAGSAGEGGAAAEARPSLRVRALPALPPGTLNQGRSLVFVANGCMGGSGFDGHLAEAYCGDGYSEFSPTVSAVLVSLSRPALFDHVGMQVVHASLANDRIDVACHAPGNPTDQNPALSIASSVVEGQVAPRPAFSSAAASDYGLMRKYLLEVTTATAMPFDESWSAVLDRSGFEQLSDGLSYALVFNGPRADLPGIPELWNAPALTLIAADPP